jgi:hypothetical protein
MARKDSGRVIAGPFPVTSFVRRLNLRHQKIFKKSSAGDGADDEERFGSRYDRVGQWRVRRFVGKVLAAGEEAEEGPTRLRSVVADGAAQRRISTLECVDYRALSDRRLQIKLDFAADARKTAQMRWENYANHGRVWTSTESTAGRSRTIGDQVSPASFDA